MKKFLSLVLALVMTMSLVTISAGAKDFTDADKVTYTEAVDVLSAVKVVDGYTDGAFKPQTVLNRGQAAKIICNLILGPTTAAALPTAVAPFSDVPANSTFAGYIAYCAKEGIVGGYADGTFKPGATLTGYAFMKMLLGALGYDAEIEGYNIPGTWSVSVAKQAIGIGLYDGLKGDFDGNKPVTREEACLFALNTLKATMVDYESKTTVTVGGADVVIAGSTAKDVKWNIASKADGNIKGDGYVQFAEKYFTDLKLNVGVGAYGRPANTWKLKTKEIGTYVVATPDYTYTKETKQDAIYKNVDKAIAKEFDWFAYVDGAYLGEVTAPVNKDKVYTVTVDGKAYTLSQDGMTTEVYVDEDAKTVNVICINQYLAEVLRVKENDDGDSYVVLKIDKYAGVLDDDTFVTDAFEEEDYAVVTVDCKDHDADKAFIASAKVPETVTGKVTLVNKEDQNGNAGVYLKTEDGEKHPYSVNTWNDLDDGDKYPDLKAEYKMYLDTNGFVLGFVSTEDVTANYLYVEKAHKGLKMDSLVVFSDATEKTITIDELNDAEATIEGNLNGKVFFYDYDEKKDNYDVETGHGIGAEVADVAGTLDVGIVNGKAYIVKDTGAGESAACIVGLKTVFVDVKDNKAYTGYKEVPSYRDVTYVPVDHNGDKVADIIFILKGDKYDDTKSFVFLESTKQDTTHIDGTKVWLYTKAYGMDGKKMDLYVEVTAAGSGKGTDYIGNKAGLYEIVKSSSDGSYVKELSYVDGINNAIGKFGPVEAISAGKKEGSFWVTNTANKQVMYTYDEETQFIVINLENDKGTLKVDTVKPGSGSDLKDGIATAFVDANTKNVAKTVYILKTPVAETKTVTISGAATVNTHDGFALDATKKIITAYKGADLKFTLKADDGKKVTKVTVGSTELKADAAGVYTIENVTTNTTVKVETIDYAEANVIVIDDDHLANVKVNGKTVVISKTDADSGLDYGESDMIAVGEDVTIQVRTSFGAEIGGIAVFEFVDGNIVDVVEIYEGETYTTTMPADGLVVGIIPAEEVDETTVKFNLPDDGSVLVDVGGVLKGNGYTVSNLSDGDTVAFKLYIADDDGENLVSVDGGTTFEAYNASKIYRVSAVEGEETEVTVATKKQTYAVTFSAASPAGWVVDTSKVPAAAEKNATFTVTLTQQVAATFNGTSTTSSVTNGSQLTPATLQTAGKTAVAPTYVDVTPGSIANNAAFQAALNNSVETSKKLYEKTGGVYADTGIDSYLDYDSSKTYGYKSDLGVAGVKAVIVLTYKVAGTGAMEITAIH